MWKDEPPVTGQARITGTAEHPAISTSFNDSEGKPFVFQMGGHDWATAMTALGFAAEMQAQGFVDLGVAVTSAAQRDALLKTLDTLFATASRDLWVARMTFHQGWSRALMATPCCQPSAMRWRICAAPPVGRCATRRCPWTPVRRSRVPGPGQCWRWDATMRRKGAT